MTLDCTLDRFLNGRISAAQPKRGFRAGHDTVLVAAAVPAGGSVLELGSGAGIASLCYASRIPESVVGGLEIDPELVAMARSNAIRNGMGERVTFEHGDVQDSTTLRGQFDHVFFNPPFHSTNGTESPNPARVLAKRGEGSAVAVWTKAALRLVRHGGTVTAILRVDRCAEMITAAEGQLTLLFPLYPRLGTVPKRAILRVQAGIKGEVRDCAGLILHRDDGSATEEADAILRGGGGITLDTGAENRVATA